MSTSPGQLSAVPSGDDFEEFVRRVDRRLRQSLIATFGPHRGADAHAAALAYAWAHQDKLASIENPVAYPYTVGRSAVCDRRKPEPVVFPRPTDDVPEYELRLPTALAALPEQQRVAVYLVLGCGWPNAEVARLQKVTESTIRSQVKTGLAQLRRELGGAYNHA